MTGRLQTIEVDAETAERLRGHAAERGVSVAELVADLIPPSAVIDDENVAELDRRWAEIERGALAVPHDEVVRWFETWGQPDFKPWHRS